MDEESIKRVRFQENLLNHIVLPRVLPQEKSKDLEQEELALLSNVKNAVQDCQEWLPATTVQLFESFERVHKTCTPESIANEIKELKPGHTFAMFVRRQNCGFFIYMPEDGNSEESSDMKTVVVATFPGNFHPKEIYEHSSDLQFDYPVQALKVKHSKMMCSIDFAGQLCLLYNNKPVAVNPSRNYVHTWLTTVLSDENTIIADFPKVTKKTRDEVLGKSDTKQSALKHNYTIYKSDYFRRSSFYMTVKVMLQHNLTLELGPVKGKSLYKIVMLHFMAQMSDFFLGTLCEKLDIDLMTQYMAKMARRIEKLPNDDRCDDIFGQIVQNAKDKITQLRIKIDQQVKDLQSELWTKAEIKPLVDLNFEAHVYQTVSKLREHLHIRSSNDGNQNIYSDVLQIKSYKRHKIDEIAAPSAAIFTQLNEEFETNLFLTDFEDWMLYNVRVDQTEFDCEKLLKWSSEYARVAEKFYSTDQLGISKMLLVRLKLVAMMDSIATKAHPLFLQHRSCIDAGVFDVLLMPQSIDMKIAFELQEYFKNRNANAVDPGLIEESEISSRSFSVKFARQNNGMLQLKQTILDGGERIVREKRREWEDNREKVRQLRDRTSRLTCDYYTYRDHNGYSRTQHSSNCTLCRLNAEINSIKMNEYERPLPQCEDERNAIVFELRIPIEISQLRDVLYLTTKFHQSSGSVGIRNDWISNHHVSHHNASKTKMVNMGSTCSVVLNSHHVDSSFETFVVLNRGSCSFHASQGTLCKTMALQTIKNLCTLAVESGSSYSGLQWTISTTAHTQNQVLARQSECPQNLSLSEFKDFGSLRADGHRLQLRKLYAMIETESLSFDQSSVLSLILQALWETGTIDECNFVRGSHCDFQDPKFAGAMIHLLEKFLQQQRNNWVSPIKLLIVAFICVRIFEINDNEEVANRCVALLNELRTVLTEWIGKIENTLHELVDRTEEHEGKLRLKLVHVSIAGAVTFFVSSKHKYFNKIFLKNDSNEYSAPRTWLHMIITLNNNIILSEHVKTQAQSNLRVFMRLVRNIGIQIEPKMKELIENDWNDVFKLVKKQWTSAARGTFGEHYFHSTCPQVCVIFVQLNSVQKHVTIDLITGTFHVNNLPVARLPGNITKNELFKRVFEQYVFEVQPDACNSFSTVHKYNGCGYEFGWSNSTLIITEHRNNGIEIELVPPKILENELPELLVENYSHWWNKYKNIIEFRPKKFSNKKFSNDLGISYKLDMHTDRLVHVQTKRNMLDINSVSYCNIQDHLSRLERQKYIHVFMDEPKIAKVELVRMNLKFKIDCTQIKDDGYDMVSNEFSGLRVSLVQNCGTLYGLNHGIYLENVPDGKEMSASPKCLILPHSKVQSSCTSAHVEANIDLSPDVLRTPPFHRYQVDEFLRQLRASNSSFSAWFYLAQLHAITSHGEVEPFTGMSGTERALQILQSSFVWSSAPYDAESIKTLQSIAHLTPVRHLAENIQLIQWPSTILKRSAQDSFYFIAKKLIEDSQRLNGLHFRSDTTNLKIGGKSNLNIRDYLRCLQLLPNLRVNELFVSHKKMKTENPTSQSITYSKNSRFVSNLYHQNKYFRAQHFNLKSFLTNTGSLDGPVHMSDVVQILNQTVDLTFSNLWITLYDVARHQKLNKEQFALIWSLFTHERKELYPTLALQTIASNAHVFQHIDPPKINQYKTSEGVYKSDEIESILKSAYSQPDRYYHIDWSDADRRRHDSGIEDDINRLTSIITSKWPCDAVDLSYYSVSGCIAVSRANVKINERLFIWNNNRKLNEFIDRVENALRDLPATNPSNPTEMTINNSPSKENWFKYAIDFEAKLCEKIDEFNEMLVESISIWTMEPITQIIERSAQMWWMILQQISYSDDKKHLIEAGMYPRMIPSLVLPRIASDSTNCELKPIIGALAISIAHEQRMNRIETYEKLPQLKPLLDLEKENMPHINWKPSDYPQWLLFEIEQNLTIRRIQNEIAERMINPPEIDGKKSSVMQLNMGEGKTAVIVPILAAFLADGEMVCQITVLKSLFATNLKSLRQYLGGMLNRRIYTFPCRRDMPIAQCVTEMLKIYEECKEMKGVILTLPEYRLSFQLKIYESVAKNDIDASTHFLTVQKWINTNVRSILDESDAILHAKYQLIYTIGKQLTLDGGAKRYSVIQDLLKRVPHHMESMYGSFGEKKIEFDQNYVQNGNIYGYPKVDYRPDVFTPCRILDESIYTDIKNLLIDDFIDGKLDVVFPEMTGTIKANVKCFLSNKEIKAEVFESVMNNFTTAERDILLTLSGLLRFEILKLVLMRRWRVNYGVNEKGTRKMAIPFKAKDVAAEMTEFGHPDVALCFTQLSYYYSGLTDDQLKRVFEILKMNQNASEIYEKWISSVPAELIEPSIKTYSGVNLSDPNQRDHILFPLLRFNMYVIDYWLSIDVYPREAKTFEKKLICTAWDLCSEHMQNHITGFSGTNDTKNILPMPIVQNDLPELEQTNENVRQTLLRPENQSYEKLPANVSGKAILERLVQKNIPVLLDSGAVMLELSNVEVAKEWLKMASEKFDAAVYFDRNDILQTIDRNDVVAEFDCSVYRENLQHCLVYLDDVHTRGTDLKFPLDWKACVTLSGDIARDKTVQACMRMRQLGKRHSIAFWASHEADIRIRSTCNLLPCDFITNKHVIEFICKNSTRFEEENTVHWATAAHNYSKKLVAHKLHENSTEPNALVELYKKCVDGEFTTLENMYGDKEEALVKDLSSMKFAKLTDLHKMNETIAKFVQNIGAAVVEKLKVQAADVKRFKHALDEEQEKELEHELEEERQVERPPQVKPATPKFDQRLIELFVNGSSDLLNHLLSENGIVSFSSSLSNTKLFAEYSGEQPWAKNLFVTEDFVRVIQDSPSGYDVFLRPVFWIGCLNSPSGGNHYIILSSFECDRLLQTFKKSTISTLCMYRPRLSKFHSNLLDEQDLRVTAANMPLNINLNLEVQISMYAGSMYFISEEEQSSYCSFLGIIPRPREDELDAAFENGIIKSNGFVDYADRNYSEAISQYVGRSQFRRNPINLVFKLACAHHQFMRNESHVASILNRSIKIKINNDRE